MLSGAFLLFFGFSFAYQSLLELDENEADEEFCLSLIICCSVTSIATT